MPDCRTVGPDLRQSGIVKQRLPKEHHQYSLAPASVSAGNGGRVSADENVIIDRHGARGGPSGGRGQLAVVPVSHVSVR